MRYDKASTCCITKHSKKEQRSVIKKAKSKYHILHSRIFHIKLHHTYDAALYFTFAASKHFIFGAAEYFIYNYSFLFLVFTLQIQCFCFGLVGLELGAILTGRNTGEFFEGTKEIGIVSKAA